MNVFIRLDRDADVDDEDDDDEAEEADDDDEEDDDEIMDVRLMFVLDIDLAEACCRPMAARRNGAFMTVSTLLARK